MLAQRSAEAAKEIRDLITNANDQVKEGVEYVLATGTSLEDIMKAIKSVERTVTDITDASEQPVLMMSLRRLPIWMKQRKKQLVLLMIVQNLRELSKAKLMSYAI